MFGFGFSEAVVILVVVIIFVRPEDLPALMRKVGQWVGQIKRAYYAILNELNIPFQ